MKWGKITIFSFVVITLLGALHVKEPLAGFKEHVIDSNFVGAFDLFVIDMDNDGDLDLLVAGQDNKQIAWYENDGSGSFYKHTISDQFSGAWCVWGKDMNRDGRIDILGASGALNEIAWWENRSGYFSEHLIDNTLRSAESVCAADFSNDGYVDIAAVGTWDSTNAVVWYENRGDDTFRKRTIDPSLVWPHDVFPVDIDQDGKMDIVVAAATSESFVWYKNQGNGSFSKNVFGWNYYGAYSVYAADINGDGYPDVQGAVHSKNEVVWWENDGGGNLITHVIDSDLEDAISVSAGDANNDGHVDILATGKNSNTVALYENDGHEHFTKIIVSNTFGGARSPVVGDFNGDGNTDIAAVALYDNKISWWENTSATPQPTITLDSHNGGENWVWGTTHSIQWHSTGSISSVNIEYSTDGGNSWKTIADNTPNSGSYSWDIPNDLSDNCLVRVVSTSNSSIYGHSDYNFSISALTISGYVFYDGSKAPIPNVTLAMSGTLEKSKKSDAEGYFLFDDLAANSNYQIVPQKAANEDVGNTAIDAYDAALAARYSVGLQDLDYYSKLAADVDNDGEVLMYDAANIARFSVGLPIPSNSLVGHWVFFPSDTTIALEQTNVADVNFQGILKGDVSKDWHYPGTGLTKEAFVSNDFLSSSCSKDTVILALRTTGVKVLSCNLDVNYNSNVAKFIGVANLQKSNGFQVIVNQSPGRIRLAGFTTRPIDPNENFLRILFKKGKTTSLPNFQVQRFVLNDRPVIVTKIDSRREAIIPSKFQLSESYPNPFNGISKFYVTLPQQGNLSISVYNMLGGKVSELVQGHFAPGRYLFKWNGCDSNGNFVSSGEYIIVAKFGTEIKRHKVLFIK